MSLLLVVSDPLDLFSIPRPPSRTTRDLCRLPRLPNPFLPNHAISRTRSLFLESEESFLSFGTDERN